MLDYTVVAGKQVWKNITVFSRIINIVSQAISILFLLYISIWGNSVLPITLTLLVISVAYLIFYCIMLAKSEQKELKKVVATVVKWCKRAIKLVNLGITIYAVASASGENTLDILLTVFSVFFWVLDILLEIVCIIVKGWGLLLYEGLKADVEKITEPVNSTKNFFKKLTGQEIEEKPEPTKRRLYLDGLVEEYQKEKAEKKQEEKETKKRQRQEKREQKKREKQEAREQKKKGKTAQPDPQEEVAATEDEKK